MRLKSITLDGFKSYAHRQELGNLDPHFNAITGLNGSGKSNVFDAICFVMGIKLKKVRAEDTRDLIYKNGNAGIQRASVTLEFINDDPATAPAGYSPDSFPTISIGRQVLTGGREKYFLNGRVTQQSSVKTFFHSVSMNVDNPHFLVLQGTVHKLLNMKPVEVLGWIEEAAGTRMFDARRRIAETLIQSKARKVDEINKIIDEEIAPMLQTISNEQTEYDNFLRIQATLETRRKFAVAYDYWTRLQIITSSAGTLQQYRDDIMTAQRLLEKLGPESGKLKLELQKVETQTEVPQEVRRWENDNEDVDTNITQRETYLKNLDKARHKVEEALKATQGDIKKNAERTTKFRQEADGFRTTFRGLQEEKKSLVAQKDNYKKSLQLLKNGMQAGENGVTLEEEKSLVDSELGRVRQQHNKLRSEQAHVTDELNSVRSRTTNTAEDRKRIEREVAQYERAAADLEKEYRTQTRGCDVDSVSKMEQRMQELRSAREQHMQRISTYGAHFAPLDYDNVPGLDLARNIYGRVGELVRVKDPSHSRALSSATTANLFKVVIRDDETAQQLIEKARLRTRTTFFPLNKVQPGHIDSGKQREAAEIARTRGGWAHLAVTLVEYPEQFRAVMDRVFGGFFLCSSLEIAKDIGYGKLRCRAVTIDGDVVDPSGVMSGGSTQGLRDFLADFNATRDTKKQLHSIHEELQKLSEQLVQSKRSVQQHAGLREKWDSAAAHLSALKKQLESHGMSANAAVERRQSLEDQMAALTQGIEGCALKEKELIARSSDLQKKLSAGIDVKAQEREIQIKMRQADSRLIDLGKELEEGKAAFDRFEAQGAELEQRDKDLTADVHSHEAEIESTLRMREEKLKEIQALKDTRDATARKIEEALARVNAAKAQVASLQMQLEANKEDQHTNTRLIHTRESDIKNMDKTVSDAKSAVKALEGQYPWIPQERAAFGDASSEYFFTDADRTAKVIQQLRQDEHALEAMSKKVNKKATMVLEQSKKEYDDLQKRRETLERDKQVILRTIKDVEEKKWKALDVLVDKVSQGFSVLFATCLPGASCRLMQDRDPSSGKLVGLEVRVAFHGKEKESLTELSGGQRSLLALCLILAILRFRPAPVYILDEVDAALDPSHTQNIGKMLQLHFKDAQFLLVSLKEGMFNNANVLYEVRNTQGYSEITRKAN
eukprot:PhM_4_TR1270/c1_g1_i1/m.84757/K06674/SMC2; structural maintenance of chromosome 2